MERWYLDFERILILEGLLELELKLWFMVYRKFQKLACCQLNSSKVFNKHSANP